jgi:hypothetical protein
MARLWQLDTCSAKGPTKQEIATIEANKTRKATLTKAQKDSLEKQKEMFQGNF